MPRRAYSHARPARARGCRATLWTPPVHNRQGDPHACDLPDNHDGLHQCWCDLEFDSKGLRYIHTQFWGDVDLTARLRHPWSSGRIGS